MRRALLALPTALVLAGLVATPAVAAPGRRAPHAPVRVDYLGETELPNALQVAGTTVGGLSGISWDRRTGSYLLVSDDRSTIDSARIYTASIDAAKGRVAVRITGIRTLKQPDGSTFPTTSEDGTVVAPDPEGIAVDPADDRFAWSSEGERVLSPLTLADPAIRFAKPDGTTVRVLPKAPQLRMTVQDAGPRRNQALEGLSFSPSGRWLWAAMEDPLLQDGANPTPARGALVRITRHDARTGLPVAQYAYPAEPLFEPGAADATNGVTDALSLGGRRLLVLERAFTTRNVVRLYEASATGATDVLGRDSLRSAPVRPASKRLVVDLSKVKGLPRIDNVEGVTVGPRLPDGRRLLLLVSDDNFSASQVTQVIAFAASGI